MAFTLTGLPADDRTPGTFGELLFAQGAAVGGGATRSAVFVMPMETTGAFTPNELVQVRSTADVDAGAGSRSPAARSIGAFMRTNKGTDVWLMPYLPTSGAGLVAADGDITFAATTITTAGRAVSTACGRSVEVIYAVSAAGAETIAELANIAAETAAKFNALVPAMPFVATAALGVVTLTAAIPGLSSGDATTGVIRFRAKVSLGTGVTAVTTGAALGLGTGTAGVEGAVPEQDQFDAALAAMSSVGHYYIGISMWTTAALTAARTHVVNKSEPKQGLRCVARAGFTGTLAAATALAVAQNYERTRLVVQPNSEHDIAELVGYRMGIESKREALDPTASFDDYSEADWLVKPVFNASDIPDAIDVRDAINDGVDLIMSTPLRSYIVMHVDTRSKDSTGLVNDFRATEAHRVSGSDYAMDSWQSRMRAYKQKKVKARPIRADGTKDYSAIPPTNTVFTDKLVKDIFNESGILESAGVIKDARYVENTMTHRQNPSNSGRVEMEFSFEIVDQLHQITMRASETSTG